jgi:hypothetical protein
MGFTMLVHTPILGIVMRVVMQLVVMGEGVVGVLNRRHLLEVGMRFHNAPLDKK